MKKHQMDRKRTKLSLAKDTVASLTGEVLKGVAGAATPSYDLTLCRTGCYDC